LARKPAPLGGHTRMKTRPVTSRIGTCMRRAARREGGGGQELSDTRTRTRTRTVSPKGVVPIHHSCSPPPCMGAQQHSTHGTVVARIGGVAHIVALQPHLASCAVRAEIQSVDSWPATGATRHRKKVSKTPGLAGNTARHAAISTTYGAQQCPRRSREGTERSAISQG
jgi:hypothetical protein